jgi:hypothetical protein
MQNGVYYISIPIDLARFLGIKENTTIVIQDEEGKHGHYISLWAKETEKKGGK